MKLYDVSEEKAKEIIAFWKQSEEISAEEEEKLKSELTDYPLKETTEKVLVHWGSDILGREAMHITVYPPGKVLRMTEETARGVKDKIEQFLRMCETRRRNKDKKPWEWIGENCD